MSRAAVKFTLAIPVAPPLALSVPIAFTIAPITTLMAPLSIPITVAIPVSVALSHGFNMWLIRPTVRQQGFSHARLAVIAFPLGNSPSSVRFVGVMLRTSTATRSSTMRPLSLTSVAIARLTFAAALAISIYVTFLLSKPAEMFFKSAATGVFRGDCEELGGFR